MAVNEHERHSIIICRLKLNERNDAFIPFLLYSLIDILHFAIFIQLWEIYTFFLQCIVMKIKFKYCWSTFLPISTKRTITSGFKLLHISMKTTAYMSILLVVVGDLLFFQKYFSYIVAVSFIVGGNQSTRRKPPRCRKSLTNFIT